MFAFTIVAGQVLIYCREVEEAISLDEAIREVAVIGVPDLTWGESVQAIIVLKDGYVRSVSDIIEHCRHQLASYKKPRSVVFVDELPKLNTGKVDKKKLRKM